MFFKDKNFLTKLKFLVSLYQKLFGPCGKLAHKQRKEEVIEWVELKDSSKQVLHSYSRKLQGFLFIFETIT